MGEPAGKLDVVTKAAQATEGDAKSTMTDKMRQSTSAARMSGGTYTRNTILAHITEERYDEAVASLKAYVASRPEYPEFSKRAARYLEHGSQLIRAIEAKRSFPGWNALNMAKQKDLFETALAHFDEFKVTLGKIEALEREERSEDVRSTVWVMRACVYSVSVLLFFAILKELSGGVFPSLNILIDSSVSQFVDFIFDKLKL